MKKKVLSLVLSGFLGISAFIYGFRSETIVNATEIEIVQTDHQLYTYTEMEEDIEKLCSIYPTLITSQSVGQTGNGRNLELLVLGNPNAPKKVMITAAIHAREYMTSQLVMKVTEYICQNYQSLNANGVPYSELFQNVAFYIMPMTNPDGVSLCQLGASASILESSRIWASSFPSLKKIKSNGNGVDLNRNFSTGFANGKHNLGPSLSSFCGFASETELETQAIERVMKTYNFDAFINYHACGELIYYGSGCSDIVSGINSANLANLLHAVTGYRLVSQLGNKPAGTLADYVSENYAKPTTTIEIGKSTPVSIKEFNNIFEKNKNAWGFVAQYAYLGII